MNLSRINSFINVLFNFSTFFTYLYPGHIFIELFHFLSDPFSSLFYTPFIISISNLSYVSFSSLSVLFTACPPLLVQPSLEKVRKRDRPTPRNSISRSLTKNSLSVVDKWHPSNYSRRAENRGDVLLPTYQSVAPRAFFYRSFQLATL